MILEASPVITISVTPSPHYDNVNAAIFSISFEENNDEKNYGGRDLNKNLICLVEKEGGGGKQNKRQLHSFTISPTQTVTVESTTIYETLDLFEQRRSI